MEIGADLILTHHPLLFHPLSSVTDSTSIGRTIRTLIRHDISVFHAHTNLDIAPEGVNHCLAKKLGLENITVIDPVETDENGVQWGLLRWGTVAEQSLEQFLSKVKEALQAPGLRYASGGKQVHTLQSAVGPAAKNGPLPFGPGATPSLPPTCATTTSGMPEMRA